MQQQIWFHLKWKIPLEAYKRESIQECIKQIYNTHYSTMVYCIRP